MDLESKYKQVCERKSDINQHLPTLKRYAEKCDHITEFGVRTIVSTYALLAGRPQIMRSFDIDVPPAQNLLELEEIVQREKLDYMFIPSDVLNVDIEETDLLFIDTLHTFDQLNAELIRHGKFVKRYIILHDTEKYGWRNHLHTTGFNLETGKKIKEPIKPDNPKGLVGLMPAIYRFVQKNHNWYIKETYLNNNGLTVLAKKPY